MKINYSQFKLLCQNHKVVDLANGLRAECTALYIGGEDIYSGLPVRVGNDCIKESYVIDENTFSSIEHTSDNKLIGIYAYYHTLANQSVTFSISNW